MRVTSEFWVAALVRRVNQSGAFAALGHKGAAEAGAIFIKFRNIDGTYDLYGPAPQMSYGESRPQERQFTSLKQSVEEPEADADLGKQKGWDRDLWIIEIEDYREDRNQLFPIAAEG